MSSIVRRWGALVGGAAVVFAAVAACAGATVTAVDYDAGTKCGAGITYCGDTCVDLATDRANCGACGAACKAGQVCSKGACAVECNGGTTLCGATCNDLQVDGNNCGACGKACGAGEVCSRGVCSTSCGAGQTQCGSACVNAQTDNANCGSCGTVCGAGQACVAGKCTLTCQQGLSLCSPPQTDGGPDSGFAGSYCANLQTDNANCGACGAACSNTTACSGGLCCGPGTSGCNGKCIDTTSDPNNCGGCGVACSNTMPFCMAGMCTAVLYATGDLGGTRKLAFVYAPKGTTLTSNSDYATFCKKNGFNQNQNQSSGTPFTSAGMYDPAAYYCTQYCCYLGSGNSRAGAITNFQNYGLPLNTALQVFDRGCGDYCGQGFAYGLNTTDTLKLTTNTSFSYAPNGSNYCQSKGTTFTTDGVVVCQTN